MWISSWVSSTMLTSGTSWPSLWGRMEGGCCSREAPGSTSRQAGCHYNTAPGSQLANTKCLDKCLDKTLHQELIWPKKKYIGVSHPKKGIGWMCNLRRHSLPLRTPSLPTRISLHWLKRIFSVQGVMDFMCRVKAPDSLKERPQRLHR